MRGKKVVFNRCSAQGKANESGSEKEITDEEVLAKGKTTLINSLPNLFTRHSMTRL